MFNEVEKKIKQAHTNQDGANERVIEDPASGNIGNTGTIVAVADLTENVEKSLK